MTLFFKLLLKPHIFLSELECLHLFMPPTHLDLLFLDFLFLFLFDSSQLFFALEFGINCALCFLVTLIVGVKQGSSVVILIVNLLEKAVLATALFLLLDRMLNFF